MNELYPIGIVLWFAQNKNPNTLFPGTTWSYIGENKTIRLASANGSDVMTTGGSDSVSLAIGNLPAHSHTISATTSVFDYGSKASSNAGAHAHNISGTANNSGAHSHSYNDLFNSFNARDWNEHATHMDIIRTPETYVASGTSDGGGTIFPYMRSTTESAGVHSHSLSGNTSNTGTHSHTVTMGSHAHTVSGNTSATGSGRSVTVANAFVKLMGWYRTA
ncbi:phage baseplate protein [Erwinia aphidicola]|uniref:phage baseplate protein n=1 Tax=Erwinia aphidicola TaxID=68334 RepID=UPI003CEB7586